MDFDCIFINGDSYSEPVSRYKTYGVFLSEQLGIPVTNLAKAGSSNKRIVRSTIENLIKSKTEFSNPLVIIGWSFVRRREVWYYGDDPQVDDYVFDTPLSRLVTLDFLLKNNLATPDQKASIPPALQIHKALTDFYTDLYLLSNYLRMNNIRYFWFSGADNTDCPIHSFPYLESLAQVKAVNTDPNIFALHDFCMLKWAQQNDHKAAPTGHLSQQGHQKFSKFLLDKLSLDV